MISNTSTLESIKQAFFRKRDILTNFNNIFCYCSSAIIKKNFNLFHFLENNTKSYKEQQEIKLCNQLNKYKLRESN
jgi:hypothetical protein